MKILVAGGEGRYISWTRLVRFQGTNLVNQIFAPHHPLPKQTELHNRFFAQEQLPIGQDMVNG